MRDRALNTPQLLLVIVSLGGCLLIKGHPVQAGLAVILVLGAQYLPFRLNLDRRGELRLVFLFSIILAGYVLQVLSRSLGMQAKLAAVLHGLAYFFGAWLLLKMIIPKGLIARNDLKAIFLRFWLGRFRDRSIQGGYYNPLYVFSVVWLLAASQGSAKPHFSILAALATVLVLYDVLSRQTGGERFHGGVLLDGYFIRGALIAALTASAIALFLPWAHKLLEAKYIAYLSGSSTGSVAERRTAIGDIGELKLSKKVVMRVATENPSYLRDGVFTFYHRGTWLNPKMRPAAIRPEKGPSSKPTEFLYLLGRAPENAPLFEMNIVCVLPKNRALATPKGTAALWVDEPELKLLPGGVPVFPEEVPRYRYRLSFVPQTPPEALSARERKGLLRLPPGFSPRIEALALSIAKDMKTPRSKISAVHNFFQARFTYSLKQEGLKGDPLEHFLLRSRAGHCEYFASSMALMLRCLGIPTRYVTGYAVKEFNDAGGYWVVRQRDAHSWLEAYIDGPGWVTLDPTPAAGLSYPAESKWRKNLAHWLDLMAHRWQDWRLETRDKTFLGILKGLYRGNIALSIILIAVLALIFGYRLVALLRGGLLARGARAQAAPSRETRETAAPDSLYTRELTLAYQRFEASLARRAGERLVFETPMEFFARVSESSITEREAGHLREVVNTYCLLRYKPGVLDQESLKDFQRLVSAGQQR